ncbi:MULTISPECIES: hypothetical protein [Flavobacterium]|uniref:DUF2231 domain-containing protein n=1 Tax=Flavobacterium ranwuense TaxID=2541725 RepID=A0ABY2DNA6_9FLAO|nr:MULTISPECIES: hypothetical protein [Flavobacterium]TDE27464.1 hypothetical protein E0I61_14195 [Flavobacterium ranwuense]TDE49262.1 hypothetical protein E0H99_15725 [Flavobacterium sp. GT3P67]
MNDAHLHIIVNHFPIIGTIFGIGILITGVFLNNNSVKNTSYVLFIVAAIFGALSMGTGEGAEEMVEDFPNIGKAIIHEHEELAEKFALVLYVTGVFALISFVASMKKFRLAKIFSFITLVLALLAGIISINVGTSGGEIRHTEIREDGSSKIVNDTDSAETELNKK